MTGVAVYMEGGGNSRDTKAALRLGMDACSLLVPMSVQTLSAEAPPMVMECRWMPEISRFFGIVVTMYYTDHALPHFHAKYGEHRISVAIEHARILSGDFPRRARDLVFEWATLHRDELLTNWELARQRKPLRKIDPLE